jgi:DNA-binding transcriptional LysR family regulator
MFDRATTRRLRIARIEALREHRTEWHRIRSAITLAGVTRVVLEFVLLGSLLGAVRAGLGAAVPPVVVLVISVPLVVALCRFIDVAWLTLGPVVRSGWKIAIVAAAVVVVGAGLFFGRRGAKDDVRVASGFVEDWVEGQRRKLDRRQRQRRILVADSAVAGPGWQWIADSGVVRMGTYAEATLWCAALGPGWGLPPRGEWAPRERWPQLPGGNVTVWTTRSGGVQIGNGGPPAVWVSWERRATEALPVLCVQEAA